MSVGAGIFLSAVLLGLVGLYAATKDRWKWKRLVKWGVGLPLALIVILGVGTWAYSEYESRPTRQDEFGGIKLTSTKADVKFIKGEPVPKHSSPDLWVYAAHSGSAREDDAAYIIRFSGETPRHVTYFANERQIVTPYLQGFTVGSTYDEVTTKLGPPSHTSTSADGLNRLLSYEKYQTFYEFTQAKVRSLGIYDPREGPVKFKKEYGAPAEPESSASAVR